MPTFVEASPSEKHANLAEDNVPPAFIGFTIPADTTLLDTGAQHGVCGPEHFKRLESKLREYNVKLREVDITQRGATGIGGE